MATDLNIYVRSLIGAKPFLDYSPGTGRSPGIKFPGRGNNDIKKDLISGETVVVEKSQGHKRHVELELDPVYSADLQTLVEMEESRQDLAICPPWTSDAITYLGLQGGLEDMREALTRSSVTFARSSGRFNSVTGRKTAWNQPHYENAPLGKGLHITSPTEDTHEPSYEFKTYLTANASDGTNVTYLTISAADAVILDGYNVDNDDIYMVSTEDETTNTFEVFEIDDINTTTGVITASTATGGAASAVLGNTSDYTVAKRCYITAVSFVSDAEMEDSGMGSWADEGAPTLAEKSTTQQETGTQCLRIISSAASSGVAQVLGSVPAGTDITICVRAKAIMNTGGSDFQIMLTNNTAVTNDLNEIITAADSDWHWYRYCVEVSGAGQNQIELKLVGAVAAPDEFLIDRCYIFKNQVPGSMAADTDGLYDAADTVTSSTGATTTFTATTAVDGTAWDLSNAAVGMIAVADGKEGRITAVDDGADTISCTWVGGTPANGSACAVRFAVAPGWSNSGASSASDTLGQDDDEHGGTWAQQIKVAAAGAGIVTSGTPTTAGNWYLWGAFFKVSSGSAQLTNGAVVLVSGINDASYTFHSAVAEHGSGLMVVRSGGVSSDFLVDDIMLIKLIGNPYDDAYYDHEPLAADGFTVFGMWKPDFANTALDTNPYMFSISRRTYDGNNRAILWYDAGNNRFDGRTISGGSSETATVAETFSADDNIYWAMKVSGAAGSQTVKVWVKVGTDAPSTGSSGGSGTTPAGLTRTQLRFGLSYVGQALGTLSGILIENAALSDADVTALIDRFSEDKWENVVTEVDGGFYRMSQELTPYPAEPDKSFGSAAMEERGFSVSARIAEQD